MTITTRGINTHNAYHTMPLLHLHILHQIGWWWGQHISSWQQLKINKTVKDDHAHAGSLNKLLAFLRSMPTLVRIFCVCVANMNAMAAHYRLLTFSWLNSHKTFSSRNVLTPVSIDWKAFGIFFRAAGRPVRGLRTALKWTGDNTPPFSLTFTHQTAPNDP